MIRRLIQHRAAQNALWLGLVQVITYVTQIAVIPYLTRRLDIAEFGATMSAMAAVALAFVITDYGFSLSCTYEVSRARHDHDRVQGIVSEVHSAKAVLVVVACLGLVGLSFAPSFRSHQWIFLAALLSVVGRAYQPIWFFQGLEDMRTYATYVALAKITYVAAVFLIVHHPGDGYRVLLSLGVADVAAALLGLFFMRRRRYRVLGLSMTAAILGLRASFDYFVSRIAVALYTSASALVVGAVSLIQAAAYTSAEQVYKAGQSVTTPINQALYPLMATTRRPVTLLKIVPVMVLVLGIGCLVIGYFAQPIVTLVFGRGYADVVPVLRIFLVTVVVNYVGVSFGYPMFAALGLPNLANKTVVVGACFHGAVLVILYGSGALSAISVALAVLATESLVAALRIFLAMKRWPHAQEA